MAKRRFAKISVFFASIALLASACSDDSTTKDTGTDDAGTQADAASDDTGTRDDAATDAGSTDGGPTDAGSTDTGSTDVGPRSIVFLHTNDEHSHFLGFSPEIDDYPTATTASTSDIVGGLARRALLLKQLRTEAAALRSPVAVVSAGDVMMGSLFHLANLAGGLDYNVQTLLRYDVMTLGNHEFDFGTDTLANALSLGYIDPLARTFDVLRIPVVVSNVRFSMSRTGDDLLATLYGVTGGTDQPLRRTHIQTFGGVKVGFVGVMGVDAALVAPFKSPLNFSLPSDPNAACTGDVDCAGSICLPPSSNPLATSGHCATDATGADFAGAMRTMVADIAAAVAELRAQNVDLVVALSHAGVNERELGALEAAHLGPENARYSEDIVLALGVDQALAQAGVPGINLVVGGHTHTALEEPIAVPNARSGITTWVVQAGQYGEYVGHIRLTRENPSAAWALDAEHSGLRAANAALDLGDLDETTLQIVNEVLAASIMGIEAGGIAQADDGIAGAGEQCDYTAEGDEILPNAGDCAGFVDGATGGTLACHDNRQLDLADCTFSFTTCGNGSVEAGEYCDGTTIPSNCGALGYLAGDLACETNCTFDVSGCTERILSAPEIYLNFALDAQALPIHDDSATPGDLFFHTIGHTSFDVGNTKVHAESNLGNFVADATRWSLNHAVPAFATRPVQVTIAANGVIRDGIFEGTTGDLSLSDMFRVLPLGISPIERTPLYPLTDFYLAAPELKGVLEAIVERGMFQSDSFFINVSGIRIRYDRTGTSSIAITRIDVVDADADPDDDAAFETTPMYDASLGSGFAAYPNPQRLMHVSISLYAALFLEGLGVCPRDENGVESPECRTCDEDADCLTQFGYACGANLHCMGPAPAAFSKRTLYFAENGFLREFKEFFALVDYIRTGVNGEIPDTYARPVPRRICCEGNNCSPTGSRACD